MYLRVSAGAITKQKVKGEKMQWGDANGHTGKTKVREQTQSLRCQQIQQLGQMAANCLDEKAPDTILHH